MILDILRLPQNKAIHCYLLLSVWILLLIGGLYKFLEPRQALPKPSVTAELFQSLSLDIKAKRIFRICNFPSDITVGEEANVLTSDWTLKGLLILIRHGDRGPLLHVRNISSIDCGGDETEILNSYKRYLNNLTASGKVSWIGPGPFHGFPLLPTHPKQCQLGQLTMQGINQLLKLGHTLNKSYREKWPKLMHLKPSEIVIYSTRYRRTFQSVLALLYGLIHHETLSKLSVLESQSLSFCFKDCGCPVVDLIWRHVRKSLSHQLKQHPAVAVLTEATGRSLFSPTSEQGELGNDPHAVRDALLTYVCHNSGLPCEAAQNCIKKQNVAGVFAYTDWVNHQKWRNIHWRKLCLLRAYGFMKNIVQNMLRMVSSSGPYLIVYSGHDHTIEQLMTVLGLQNDPFLLRYAARIIFEVYQKKTNSNGAAQGLYFRLLSNGRDVTKQITFCKNIVRLEDKINLCKIEDIVRFIHDDYFIGLNATNYKDACVLPKD